MDWIGDMGGVPGILKDMCAMVIGGWAAFHSLYVTVSVLYKVKSHKRAFAETDDDEEESRLDMQIFNLPIYVRFALFLKTHYIAKYLCYCCCKGE